MLEKNKGLVKFTGFFSLNINLPAGLSVEFALMPSSLALYTANATADGASQEVERLRQQLREAEAKIAHVEEVREKNKSCGCSSSGRHR